MDWRKLPEARAWLEHDNKLHPEHLVEMQVAGAGRAKRAWRSRGFLVQLHEAPDPALFRLSINRTSLLDDGRWDDNISWDDIQRLKAEAGFAHMWAVECYPPDAAIVNVANMRHIFLLSEAPTFGWKR